jgi:hypothetical protein
VQIASCSNHPWIFFPKRALAWVCLLMGLLALVLLFGCAGGSPSFSAQQGIHLQGSVHGGQQPISGSLIQLYAAGTTGNGSPAIPLISEAIRTDSSGNFDINGLYTCPTSDSIVYLVAQGGNPGLAPGTNNSSIALLAALGPCGALTSSASISINEVTTVASLWPLAPYAESSARIGFASESSYQAVGDYIDSLANISAGTAPGPMLTPPDIAPTTKLYTLAGIFSACVKSLGGDAGDGTPCGRLFSDATIGSNAPPSDTVAAAIAIAQHPSQNVADIYYLLPPSSTFQPTLASPPSDWTLPIISAPAAPLLSPASGSYASGQQANIEESTPGASIYYTTDGSVPTGSSLLYSGPFPLTRSQTVNAVAIIDGLSSAVASNTYTINAQVSVSLMPASVTLAPLQTQMFSATVANSSNTAVTWSLSPAVGSISGSGVYTAPATIAASQIVTVTATSAADSTKMASSRVTLASIPAPTFFPAPGAYTSTTSVTLSDGDSSAMIYYTTDGSTPSASSTRYTEAIPLSISATVRAIAINGSLNSAVTSGYYTISAPPAMVVTLTPTNAIIPVGLNQQFSAFVAGTQTTAVTWAVSGTGCSGTACGTISSSGIYTAPASVPASATITVTATSVSDPTRFASATIAILQPTSIQLPTPTVSLLPAIFAPGITVGLADTNPAAVICYTTDGTDPALSSAGNCGSGARTYTAPIALTATTTIRAVAVLPGTNEISNSLSATYAVQPGSNNIKLDQSLTLGSAQTAIATPAATTTSLVRAQSGGQILWQLLPNPWGASNRYSGTTSVAYSGTGTITTTVAMSNLPNAPVNGYPLVFYGSDVYGDHIGDDNVDFPALLSQMGSLLVNVNYALTNTAVPANQDIAFDEWLVPSRPFSGGPSGAVEVIVCPYYNFSEPPPGPLVGTFADTVLLTGVITSLQFNEYLEGHGAGALVLFAPSTTQLPSANLQLNLLDFLQQGAMLAGVPGWYVAGFDYGTEYGNSSTASYTLTTTKLGLSQMLRPASD